MGEQTATALSPMTQSGHFTQNPPNMRPNVPGVGAGVGDGCVGDAVRVPLDRKVAGRSA